jgi:UDP-N-acetylmuramoyl-L-alanyl-D-glutamate--2,6-diaminopimelate ligase
MTDYLMGFKPRAITADSREVMPGTLFLAYPGEYADGRSYIADAINKGASAVFWDPEGFVWDKNWQIDNVPVINLKQEAGLIAAEFHAEPSSQLWVIGVTGTNGKTSVTQWLGQCFDTLNRQSAIIGTLGNGLLNQLAPTSNTTPDALLLQRLLAGYLEQKVGVVAMEVSSHGLSQGRVNGVQFDVAILTNLTRDHLDYHGTFENYASAKEKLFKWDGLKHVVLNSDDDFGVRIKQKLSAATLNVLTYGIDSGDVRASDIRFENAAMQFRVTTPYGKADVEVDLVGRFNVYNVLAVLSALLVSDVSLLDAIDAIRQLKVLKGRMQQFGGGHLPLVIVDYAHTPDSLKNVLVTLREQAKQQLVCVFGCGGNRDAGKREMMGKVASEFADSVIITTDNPRHEPIDNIIQAILKGIEGGCVIEADRAKAIAMAIANAQKDDIVLIAGKGHEEYQEIAGEQFRFSDGEHVIQALKSYQEGSL